MSYPTTATVSPGNGVGAVAPNTAYSGVFIPEIWAGKIVEKFYDATVLAAISNTDYEGEIKNKGDKVNIRTKPTITISDYVADQTLDVERPSSDLETLLIDKGKYFNTILDDVMEVQSDLNQLSMWADDASEQMKIVIDTDVLAYIPGQIPIAANGNQGDSCGRISGNIDLGITATPRAVLPADVIDLVVDMGQVLDEQNIPESGRWLVIPAWMAAMIKKSELRDASLVGDGTSMLRNGRLGMIDRFTVYLSNLLPLSGVETSVMAGHSVGLTFASQLTKVETLRGESYFGTYLRGLQVYGRSVIDPTAITVAIATKG
ncbi:MAG: hypothetical protein DRP64_00045 [Verrucomicrobia bacterium]|nr:MAG: hypothetical protein DRP64_00045 [Verrucomicrobiota bacterium]